MRHELVVVGASWGGLEAVARLLEGLPGDFPAPVVVVQHRGVDSTGGVLEAMWRRSTKLRLCEVDDKDSLSPGTVYVAPADYHLIVEPGTLALSVDERVQYSRPSIDVTFEAAADAYRERLVAILLTGANEDGAHGMGRVRELGGCTIAQEPSEADRPEMPQAAIDAGAVSCVLPLARIAPFVVELCQGERSPA